MFKKIKLQLIPTSLYFFYGDSDFIPFLEKNVKDYKRFIDFSDGRTISTYCDNGHTVIIRVTDRKLRVNELIGLIAHELNHAKDFIYEEHGFNCQELGSYFIQYTLEEILNFLDKKGIK